MEKSSDAAPAIRIAPADPADPAAAACLRRYEQELADLFGFDAAGSAVEPAELLPPRGLLLVATADGGEALGCGALRLPADGTQWAEIKRLWVSGAARGTGLGRKLLEALEAHARDGGAHTVRLDTNSGLTAALALYRSAGYVEIPRYNDNPYAHHWFEKPLV